MEKACPCQSGKTYSQCCENFINGSQKPASPEELMRSRYTAFCFQEMDYLEETTDPTMKESFDREANEEWAKAAKFEGLNVMSTSSEGDKGEVEFTAHFEIDGEKLQHHERSQFVKKNGEWFFHSGEVDEDNGYFYDDEESSGENADENA